MSKLSKLFDSRSREYDSIYNASCPEKLLHQEKRLRAEIVTNMVIEYLSSTKEAKVVDVGCGMGNVLLNLKENGIRAEMYGVDISKEMIGLANKNLKNYGYENINFIKGSIEDIDFKTDILLSLGVIGYQKKQVEFLVKLSNVIDNQGYLIFTTANGDSILRLMRRCLSRLHSIVKRNAKSKGEEFLSIRNKHIDRTLTDQGFKLEKKIYITFGLGLFASSFECYIDSLLFRCFHNSIIGKYFSLSVIYAYKKID